MSHARPADESHTAVEPLFLVQTAPAGCGHIMLGHEALLQLTSHLHEPAQSTSPHDVWSEHVTSHGPAPQVIAPHAETALQVMSQLLL